MDFHDARTCVIFGAGDYYDETPAIPDAAFVVAADGGLDHARAFGIDADFVVGDFDSITGDRPTQNDRTIALPSEKDDPDLLSALKIGWLRGARTFHIYGALGGRIDHTISNIQLMALLADRGATGYLHGDGSIVTAICDGALDFPADDAVAGRMVSVFSHSDISTGVSETGLKYELHHADMSSTRVPHHGGAWHAHRHVPHRGSPAARGAMAWLLRRSRCIGHGRILRAGRAKRPLNACGTCM